MLIEFSVKNFRSIKERQKLSLVAASGDELRKTHTVNVLDSKLTLLRSAAVYGPNASGKTNLIRALQTMKLIIRDSARNQHGLDLPVTPYAFDQIAQEQPTEFEVIFVSNGIRYQYGFTATRKQIFEEWLLAYPKGRAQAWIDRKFDPQTQSYEWGNTDKLAGPKHLWQEVTRPNALFLSTAIQLNSKQLQPVADWFEMKLGILTGVGPMLPEFTVRYCQGSQSKRRIVHFLQTADFSIDNLEIKREIAPNDHALAGFQLQVFGKDSGYVENVNIQFAHIGSDGTQVSLDLDEESDGTQKFFGLAGPWLTALEDGLVLLIDELNDNLHPNLVRFMVQLFHNQNINRRNAQLLFTTHETSILTQDLFRRDQIWFTEKDEYNATTLYPLSDFSPRKGVENIEKNYLQGRYGALPYFGDVARLFGVNDEPKSA